MGLRTMASPNGAQAPEFSHALINHALEELQYLFPEHGKPQYKMNTEELANTVQQFQASTSSSSSSSASITPSLPADCNMNATRHKTVQEVLRDIAGQEGHGSEKKHAVFADNTLENLIQAGAINQGYEGRSQSLAATEPGVEQQHKWVQYEEEASKQQEQQSIAFLGSSLPMFDNAAAVNAGFSEGQQVGMPVGSIALAKPASSDSQMHGEINRNDEIVDKSIERRQKRMIKNRESAARSRARKQAYINHLEDKVKKLEDTNMQLKRQMIPEHGGLNQKHKTENMLSSEGRGGSQSISFGIQYFFLYVRT